MAYTGQMFKPEWRDVSPAPASTKISTGLGCAGKVQRARQSNGAMGARRGAPVMWEPMRRQPATVGRVLARASSIGCTYLMASDHNLKNTFDD